MLITQAQVVGSKPLLRALRSYDAEFTDDEWDSLAGHPRVALADIGDPDYAHRIFDEVEDLVWSGLTCDYRDRPTASQLLSHAYFGDDSGVVIYSSSSCSSYFDT